MESTNARESPPRKPPQISRFAPFLLKLIIFGNKIKGVYTTMIFEINTIKTERMPVKMY